MNTLVLMGVQREYLSEGRRYRMQGIRPSLQKIEMLLLHARQRRWLIVHVQHLEVGAYFSADEPHSKLIEGFEPLEGEWLIAKSKLSAYSNGNFRHILDRAPGKVYVAGYCSSSGCAATIAAAELHNHRLTLVQDASWTIESAGTSEADMHRCACAMLRLHCDLINTNDCLALEGNMQAA